MVVKVLKWVMVVYILWSETYVWEETVRMSVVCLCIALLFPIVHRVISELMYCWMEI